MNLDLADEGSWQIAVVFVRHMNYLCILHLPVGLRHVLEIASSLCGSDLSTAITIRTVSYGFARALWFFGVCATCNSKPYLFDDG